MPDEGRRIEEEKQPAIRIHPAVYWWVYLLIFIRMLNDAQLTNRNMAASRSSSKVNELFESREMPPH
jgi:hypothetical protein